MIKNLPRELLWANKTDISELMSDKLGKEVVSTFSFAKSRIAISLSAETMLMLYNEAFYLSTRVVYEHDAEARPEAYIKGLLADWGDQEMVNHVIFLMFTVLMLQSDKSKEVLQFTDRLQKEHLSQMPFHILNWFNKVFKPRKNRVDLLLKPCPYPPEWLHDFDLDWNKITMGFSKRVIIDLLDLWSCDNEKGKVIRLIDNAYKLCRPVSVNEELADTVDDEFITQQKNLYNVVNGVKKMYICKGGRPESKSLDELFTDTCLPAQRIKLITIVKSLKGKAAVFALRVAALPEVGMIKQVPSYSKAREYFPNIGAQSGYYKYKDKKMVMDYDEIEQYKRMLFQRKA